MALEATHIRFALDLKDKYKVSDIKKYVSGTVYPDSRYVTGIDRSLTHPEDFFNQDMIKLDDFKKGWFVHLLCDKVQYEVTQEKFPELLKLESGQGSAKWIYHTAIKNLLDINQAQEFDIKGCLSYLDYIESPNGEDREKLLEYNRIFQKMYADPAALSIEACYKMWKLFGIGDELADKVKSKTEEFQKDKNAMELISQIYPEMLLRVK